jgi:hypothetical protein
MLGSNGERRSSRDIGSCGSSTSVEKVERCRKRPFCRSMLYQHFANPAQGQWSRQVGMVDRRAPTPRLGSRPRLRYLLACFHLLVVFGKVERTMSSSKVNSKFPSYAASGIASGIASEDAGRISRCSLTNKMRHSSIVCRSDVSKQCFNSSLARVSCWYLPVLAMLLLASARVSEVVAAVIVVGGRC